MNKTWVGSVGLVVALAAGSSLAQDITIVDLGYDVSFTVEQDAATRGIRVAVSQLDDEWQSVGIGNAGFSPQDMQKVRFCPDCAEVYFLPIWDAPRTYGTFTGVVVYERGAGGWSLSILPLDRPTVEDKDGDGVFALVDNPPNGDPIDYVFRDGLLAVVAKTAN